MKKFKLSLFALALTGAVFTSCSDDDDVQIINEEEVITTVEYRLTDNDDPSNIVVFRSVDNDADGPNTPQITVIGSLDANSTYSGSVRFLNETESPAENITEEVQEESDEHEVFYTTSTNGVQITKTDTDSDGNPLGLRTTFQTGAATSGQLVVILRHEPTKPNNGTPSSAGGETDVQATFPIEVQ
jgi:hypothetical protein